LYKRPIGMNRRELRHEFGNLIGAARLVLDAVRAGTDDAPVTIERAQLENLRRALEEMRQLFVDDDPGPRPRAATLAQVVSRALATLPLDRPVELAITLRGGGPLRGDARKLGVKLRVQLQRALLRAPEGGRVTVEAAVVSTNASRVRLAVRVERAPRRLR
jgi:hypothetical protein